MSKPKPSSPNSQLPHTKECMEAFSLFGDLPTLAIIFFLSEGPRRFNELEKLTGTNPVTLSARLKKLDEQNIIIRAEKEADKQSVTYSLGSAGTSALPIINQIVKFSRELPTTPGSG